MRVLGIDPGYDRCGLAIAERTKSGKDILLYSVCITTPKDSHADRLGVIVHEVKKIIEKYNPSVAAVETLFFSKNKKTALAVAEARGAILATISGLGLSSYEYSPQEIKLAVTGYGASSKEQVANMVRRLIDISEDIEHDDEFDAIAVSLTHLATSIR